MTPRYDNVKLGLKKGEQVDVDVFGCYQVRADEDDIDAYFVVELPDGRCAYAAIDTIQFVYREGENNEPPIYCN
jgi:hypothetical protein